jgi:hypothetical protein
MSQPQRFNFTIDPKTPLKDLLPVPPAVRKAGVPVLPTRLSQVPEVEFQAFYAKDLPTPEATKQTAHTIAKINHLNSHKTDRFMEALRSERSDLSGLPFAMGEACRTKGEQSKQFARAVATVRRALQSQGGVQPVVQSFTSAVNLFTTTGSTQVQPPRSEPSDAPQVVQPTATAPAGAPQPNPSASSAPPQPAPAVPTSAPQNAVTAIVAPPVAAAPPDQNHAEGFWEQYATLCAQEDKSGSRADRALCDHVTKARVAALMQVLAPESVDMRLGLVKYLSAVPHVEATRALGRLAIFSPEDEVYASAVEALKVRRERDYTDVLVQGLRYPWPAVARRAAEAIVRLERNDLINKLVEVLDEPDPRAPVVKEVNEKKVPVVQELVRVNHHRSCLLCHAPGNTGTVSPESVTAAVPVPGEPLPSPSEGYRVSSPDLLVRVDVTYLRQDFSLFQPVGDANPWPEMQRFDFLVRSRVVTDEEADAYRAKLAPREPGRLSPYHRTALAALRELTGRDTAPTAEAWRRLLELPAPQRRPAATP